MKKLGIVIAFLLALNLLSAQSSNNGVFVMTQANSPSSCAWPSGATFTNAMALCATSGGLYYALNGNATFNPVGAASGVVTFNGRSGPVLPAANDYKYSDLANKPTSLNCSTSNQGNTGLTASGCTFQ